MPTHEPPMFLPRVTFGSNQCGMPRFPAIQDNLLASCLLPDLPSTILEGTPANPRTCTGLQLSPPFYRKDDKLHVTESQTCADDGDVFGARGNEIQIAMCCPGQAGGDSAGDGTQHPPLPPPPTGGTGSNCPAGTTCCVNLTACSAITSGTITVTGPGGTQTLTWPTNCFSVTTPGSYTIVVSMTGYQTVTTTLNVDCSTGSVNVTLTPSTVTVRVYVYDCACATPGCSASCYQGCHPGVSGSLSTGDNFTTNSQCYADVPVAVSSLPAGGGTVTVTIPSYCYGLADGTGSVMVGPDFCQLYTIAIRMQPKAGYNCCNCGAVPNNATFTCVYGTMTAPSTGLPANAYEPQARQFGFGTISTNNNKPIYGYGCLQDPGQPALTYNVTFCAAPDVADKIRVTVIKSGYVCGDTTTCSGWIWKADGNYPPNGGALYAQETRTVDVPLCSPLNASLTFSGPYLHNLSDNSGCPVASIVDWNETVTVTAP